MESRAVKLTGKAENNRRSSEFDAPGCRKSLCRPSDLGELPGSVADSHVITVLAPAGNARKHYR